MYLEFQKKEKLQQSIPITQNRNSHNNTSTTLVPSTVSKFQNQFYVWYNYRRISYNRISH